MNPADTNVPPTFDPMPALVARRRATFSALFGLAVVANPAAAQMGGGVGGHGMRGQQPPQDAARPDKDKDKDKDTHAEAAPPRDLVAAFARRLRDGVPELALTASQQNAWHDVVALLGEVGEHNERRLQRIFWRSAGSVSAASPLKSFIVAEVDEGEARQQALAELQVDFAKLDALLDQRQRDLLTNLFVATRSELQASRDR